MSGGCTTVYSVAVKITVYGDLTAGAIEAEQTICYNTAPEQLTNKTSPTGGSDSYTYQWQQSANGTSDWTNVTGGTGAASEAYTPPALTATTWYRRAVTSGGCTTVYSAKVKITVYGDLTAGAIEAEQTICYNTAPEQLTNKTSPTGGSSTYTYQWQQSADGTSDWANVTGGTGAASEAYTPPALTATTWYRRVVTSGTCTASSAEVKITIYGNLTGGAAGSDQTICYNTVPAPFTSSTSADGGDHTPDYLWQYSTDGISWTDIDGVTSEGYVPVDALTVTTQYRRRAANGCGTVHTNPVTVTVRPELPLDYPDIRIRICPDGNSVNLSKYLDTLELTSIKWESLSPAAPVTDVVAGTVSTDKLKAPTVYTFTYTVSNPCATDVRRKVYLEALNPDRMRPLRDTVVICYEYAEALQINQLFGIEARGEWSYLADGNITPYITESNSATHDGAVVMNGKPIYENIPTTFPYHGIATKRVTVTYTPATDSCLDGNTYSIVIILTPDIL
jgi:hypothetical protein